MNLHTKRELSESSAKGVDSRSDVGMKYLHAINILTMAKVGALQNIFDHFQGDWEKAWQADLARFIPREKDKTGKLIRIDYQTAKNKINVEYEWRRLQKEKIELLTILDDEYPKRTLAHIFAPPFLLYIRGSKKVLKNKCFGVVGTRALTEYGRRATPVITQDLVRGGLTIVSGLAGGIDTLAHKAALASGGKTIAVLGCGLDDQTIFPQQNLQLAHKIIETGGAVITEYAPGTHGTVFTFPQRNRIISGLSRGVLVVEADIQSGALITARNAIEQNRDLFCVPGNIYSRTSQGTNFMIKEGAKLVSCGQDILEEYNIQLESKKIIIQAENEIEAKILAVLSSETISTDDIIRQTGLPTSQVNSALVVMELNRKIKNLGSNRYVLFS